MRRPRARSRNGCARPTPGWPTGFGLDAGGPWRGGWTLTCVSSAAFVVRGAELNKLISQPAGFGLCLAEAMESGDLGVQQDVAELVGERRDRRKQAIAFVVEIHGLPCNTYGKPYKGCLHAEAAPRPPPRRCRRWRDRGDHDVPCIERGHRADRRYRGHPRAAA